MKIITQAVEEFIAAKAQTGASSRAISAMLLAEMGVTLSHKGVANEMTKRRNERSDIAKNVLREKLGKTLLGDIDRLERVRKQVNARAAKVKDRESPGGGKTEWLMCKELEVKILDRKIHYSGADTPDDTLSELEAAGDRVASRVADLIGQDQEADGEPDDAGEGGP